MQSIKVEKGKLYSFRQVTLDEHYNEVVLSSCIVWFDENGMHFGPAL